MGQGLAVKLALHIPLELSRNPLDSLAPNYRLFRWGCWGGVPAVGGGCACWAHAVRWFPWADG